MIKTKKRIFLSLLISIKLSGFLVQAAQYCKYNETTCWPTIDDIQKLNETLNTTANRQLAWKGSESPRPSAVPINSAGDQPLYGLGNDTMKPLYVRTEEDRKNQCFMPFGDNPYVSEYCLASVRNTP